MIFRKIPVYNFENLSFHIIKNGDFLKENFYIYLPVFSGIKEEKVLFNAPDSLLIRIIKRSLYDGSDDNAAIHREGCFYYNEWQEYILEVNCDMMTKSGNEKRKCVVRLPISMPSVKEGNIGIYFDGAWVRIMQNGEILNENSGLDCFCEPSDDIYISDDFKDIKAAKVNGVNVTYREQKCDMSADFYFPHGFNTFVGDVMTFTHNNTYHLMYLLDRRHHSSRNACGAHYIAHMTSENLVDWYEQTPIAEITEPWQTYGTGTMLFHNGKYYMTYGLHTERYLGDEPKIEPKFDSEKREFIPISYDDIYAQGGLPAGASYSVSDNGIDFTPSNLLFHAARNPSAYLNEKGTIDLYCGYGGEGVFTSNSFDETFKVSKNNFEFVKNSLTHNTSECPALFSWNRYKYLIVGFTGYFRTRKPNSDEFFDAALLGENIYDGLSVPMVASFKDNRRIIAGWVRSPHGWGGVLMQRELIQEEGGKLGMKWIPELAPKLKNEIKGNKLEKYKSYYLEFEVNPNNANRFGVSFANGKTACTLTLDFNKKRVQINDAEYGEFGGEILTMPELLTDVEAGKPYSTSNSYNLPNNARNYCLPDIQGIDKPFKLKLMLRYSKRMRATVIDAEIAERRTLISVRENFFPTEFTTVCDVDNIVNDIKLFEL